MKEKLNSNIIKTFFYTILLLSIIIGALFLFYKENNKGYLKIIYPSQKETALKIFIDKKEIKTQKLSTPIKLTVGTHSILLSKINSWPWATTLNILKKQTYQIYPFFVPKKTKESIISPKNPAYKKIISLFNSKKTFINWEKDKNTPSIIKNFVSKIKASDFYKNREDVIIIAVKNGIYALEINSSPIPNFQPIYKGNNPTFVKKDNNTLYVKDGKKLLEVSY